MGRAPRSAGGVLPAHAGCAPCSAAESLDSSTEQTAPEVTTTTTVVADPSTGQDGTASTPEETAPPSTEAAPASDQATSVTPIQLLTGPPSNTGTTDGAAPIVISRRSDQKAAQTAAGPVVNSNILSSALPSADSVSTSESSNGTPAADADLTSAVANLVGSAADASGVTHSTVRASLPDSADRIAAAELLAGNESNGSSSSGVTFTRDGRCRTIANGDLTNVLVIVIGRDCNAKGHSQAPANQARRARSSRSAATSAHPPPEGPAATPRRPASQSAATPTAPRLVAPEGHRQSDLCVSIGKAGYANGIAMGGDHQGGTAGSANNLVLALGGGDGTGTAIGGTSGGMRKVQSVGDGGSANAAGSPTAASTGSGSAGLAASSDNNGSTGGASSNTGTSPSAGTGSSSGTGNGGNGTTGTDHFQLGHPGSDQR